jgi:hypothetical protein
MPSTVAQIEYGDFYKFVVSLGIALVLAAILAPWLFLREPFDLMIEASRLSQLTPAAQQIVLLRQTYLLRLLPVIPWFSFSLLIIGAGAISIGLKKWYNRQTLRDTSEDLGVQREGGCRRSNRGWFGRGRPCTRSQHGESSQGD